MWFKHSSQFDIVYIWISKFNAIIATIYQLLLQCKHSYIRWLSNCGICIRCAAYVYIHKPKQSELTPGGRLVWYQIGLINYPYNISYVFKFQVGFSHCPELLTFYYLFGDKCTIYLMVSGSFNSVDNIEDVQMRQNRC